MQLKPGDKLGAYEIVLLLGKGGMGEVWKAHDAQIGRDVAIKVSDKQFSDRFEREVRAIGALNHNNICTLYHVGPDYLVMEYIEGPTLAERIQQGPIPLDEALGIAKQIAAALEAAHEKPIVHRDLKPANVKIRPDGSVKVLDFGLAGNGHELFFRTEDNRIMVATYAAKADSFVPDKPRVWSDKQLANRGIVSNYDLAPDGKRIAALMPAETPETQQTQNHVIFLMNFADELQRKVPAGK